MDCQGTGADLHTSKMDNLIMFLGLQLSDTFILDVHGKLATDYLEELNVS